MPTTFRPVSSLFEQYRPATWEAVIGQDKAKRTLDSIRKRCGSLFGRAVWISGKSGTGKTTFARLMAAECADEWCIEELDAGTLTVADLAKIEQSWHLLGMGKGGRAYIVNESHGLRKPVIRQLLVILERIPAHCLVVFTTTLDGQDSLFEDCDDASPLLSRCTRIQLESRGQTPLAAQRLYDAAVAEGLCGKPLEQFIRAVNDARGNWREVYNRIEAGDFL